MGKGRVNVANKVLCCAFCKHWYDPTFSHIHPTGDALMKIWEYDKDAKSMCEISHKEHFSYCVCNRFEKKDLK